MIAAVATAARLPPWWPFLLLLAIGLLLARPGHAAEPWSQEELERYLGPQPAREEDHAGECGRAKVLPPGATLDCQAIAVPPQHYAYLLATESWFGGALPLAQAAAARAADEAGKQHQSAEDWKAQAERRRGCGPVCVGAVAGGGVVVGAGLAVAVVYAVVPAAQALQAGR